MSSYEPLASATPLMVGAIGSPEFARRLTAALRGIPKVQVATAPHESAWSLVASHRPDIVLLEIGLRYDMRLHRRVRQFLQQLRSRDDDETFVALVLADPRAIFFGGDLLFSEEERAPEGGPPPHGLIDSFLAPPPGPGLPSLDAQVANLIELQRHVLTQRARAELSGAPWTRLPALNTPGWAHSLADPHSRELWMRWLPRYAKYLNENPLIIGETGTGKTNLAYALHLLSGRSGRFVSITPRDFSSSELVQAELFGAVAGAYTGAVDKWGLVKSAERGTLFIDELQSIDKDLQGKLITFIENKIYRRVGSSESIAADVRFVFASNRTLADLLHREVLRDDFAYRLERVQLELSPLHERALDIVAALAFALAKIHRQRPNPDPVLGFTPGALRYFFSHPWPGNLRQLENAVAKGCELAEMRSSQLIDESVVQEVFRGKLFGNPDSTREVLAHAALDTSAALLAGQPASLADAQRTLTHIAHERALTASAGDLDAAAHLLGEPAALLQHTLDGILINEQRANAERS